MGAGMGFAGAPATESIMSSLPPDRANTGSAVNDTTRELGGALGVAIVGSIMSSLYASQLPGGVPAAARESVAAGVRLGPETAAAVREAFVLALSRASIAVAVVAALGAVIAWHWLPARAAASARHPGRAAAGPRSRSGAGSAGRPPS
jgi:DHA2 family multidrug resistance protein-like MFS transporter